MEPVLNKSETVPGYLEYWEKITVLELDLMEVNDRIQKGAEKFFQELNHSFNEQPSVSLQCKEELGQKGNNLNIFIKLACEMNADNQIFLELLNKITLTQEDLYCLCVYKKIELVDCTVQSIMWDDVNRLMNNTPFKKASQEVETTSSSQSLLHQASLHNNLSFVKYLIEVKKANVDVEDSNQETPLLTAVSSPTLEVVIELIAAKANIHVANRYGTTPLHRASARNQRAIMDYLISQGANIESKNIVDQRPLERALEELSFSSAFFLMRKGSPLKLTLKESNVVKFLLHICENEHEASDATKQAIIESVLKIHPSLAMREPEKMWELLNAVSEKGYFLVLKALMQHLLMSRQIKLTELLNKPGNNGNTPLHVACIAKSSPCILLLIESGADIHQANKDDKTPVDLIFQFGLETILKELWRKKLIKLSKIKTQECRLSLICQEGDAETGLALIKEMQQSGKDLSLPPYSDAKTYLHIACQHRNRDLIQILVKHGADINKMDLTGRTPLHETLDVKMWDIALILIAHGANPDIADLNGYTPIALAIENDLGMLALQLAKITNDPLLAQRKTRLGYSIFQMACEKEYWSLALLLFKKGGSIDDLKPDSLRSKFCEYELQNASNKVTHEH
ncbi:MAG: ankyrin repeat domain-containing protein [Parachlamydiaceae bacterium]|nr:ankyrin repeat domain-containing protein [Parachlamydiaceae bacterium]